MFKTEDLEVIAKRVVAAAALAALSTATLSWLGAYRAPRERAVAPGRRLLGLSAWAQFASGLSVLALLVGLGRALWVPIPLPIGKRRAQTLGGTAVSFSLVGIILVPWTRIALGTMFGVSTSFAARLRVGHRLARQGPYALVRHPLYLGYLLLLLSAALAYRTWSAVALLAIGIATFLGRVRREEAALAAEFGSEWPDYAARTSCLIPFVY